LLENSTNATTIETTHNTSKPINTRLKFDRHGTFVQTSRKVGIQKKKRAKIGFQQFVEREKKNKNKLGLDFFSTMH